MSDSSIPRIKKGLGPSVKLTESNFRKKVLPYLVTDFGGRCGYSMRHMSNFRTTSEMEVDHFDPTLTGRKRNSYDNAMFATRHCNGSKRASWPTKQDREQGFRFLNPCKEQDYGKHIFEDPKTHELVGASTEGRYHIDMLDLNNPSYVWERQMRAAYMRAKRECPALLCGSFAEIGDALKFVDDLMERFIPEIPAPPAGLSSKALQTEIVSTG